MSRPAPDVDASVQAPVKRKRRTKETIAALKRMTEESVPAIPQHTAYGLNPPWPADEYGYIAPVTDVTLRDGRVDNNRWPLRMRTLRIECTKSLDLRAPYQESGIRPMPIPSCVTTLIIRSQLDINTPMSEWKLPFGLRELRLEVSGFIDMRKFRLPSELETLFMPVYSRTNMRGMIFPDSLRHIEMHVYEEYDEVNDPRIAPLENLAWPPHLQTLTLTGIMHGRLNLSVVQRTLTRLEFGPEVETRLVSYTGLDNLEVLVCNPTNLPDPGVDPTTDIALPKLKRLIVHTDVEWATRKPGVRILNRLDLFACMAGKDAIRARDVRIAAGLYLPYDEFESDLFDCDELDCGESDYDIHVRTYTASELATIPLRSERARVLEQSMEDLNY
jgi:hypothetical protein